VTTPNAGAIHDAPPERAHVAETIVTVARLLLAAVLASLPGCSSTPPPSAFEDVPVTQHALPGRRSLPSFRDGDELLDIWLERDQTDLLLYLGWERPMTEAELQMPLSPLLTPGEFPQVSTDLAKEPIIIAFGPRRLTVKSWDAASMEPLHCVGQDMPGGANLGVWSCGSCYRIPMTGNPICLAITFNDQQHYWRVQPVW
jgi:hypothetical protein